MLFSPMWPTSMRNEDRFDIRKVFFKWQSGIVVQRDGKTLPAIVRTNEILIRGNRATKHPPGYFLSVPFFYAFSDLAKTFHARLLLEGIFHLIKTQLTSSRQYLANPSLFSFFDLVLKWK